MTTTDTYNVIGMTCDHCAHAVTAEVSAIDGVSDVHVNVNTGKVQVTAVRAIPATEVREAIEEAGYTLA